MGLEGLQLDEGLTLYPLRFSTTQESRASLPTVTVMLGIGSEILGKLSSAKGEKEGVSGSTGSH